jgi:hypothetical protein
MLRMKDGVSHVLLVTSALMKEQASLLQQTIALKATSALQALPIRFHALQALIESQLPLELADQHASSVQMGTIALEWSTRLQSLLYLLHVNLDSIVMILQATIVQRSVKQEGTVNNSL